MLHMPNLPTGRTFKVVAKSREGQAGSKWVFNKVHCKAKQISGIGKEVEGTGGPPESERLRGVDVIRCENFL